MEERQELIMEFYPEKPMLNLYFFHWYSVLVFHFIFADYREFIVILNRECTPLHFLLINNSNVCFIFEFILKISQKKLELFSQKSMSVTLLFLLSCNYTNGARDINIVNELCLRWHLHIYYF